MRLCLILSLPTAFQSADPSTIDDSAAYGATKATKIDKVEVEATASLDVPSSGSVEVSPLFRGPKPPTSSSKAKDGEDWSPLKECDEKTDCEIIGMIGYFLGEIVRMETIFSNPIYLINRETAKIDSSILSYFSHAFSEGDLTPTENVASAHFPVISIDFDVSEHLNKIQREPRGPQGLRSFLIEAKHEYDKRRETYNRLVDVYIKSPLGILRDLKETSKLEEKQSASFLVDLFLLLSAQNYDSKSL